MFLSLYNIPNNNLHLLSKKSFNALMSAGGMHKFLLEEMFDVPDGDNRASINLLYHLEEMNNGYILFVQSDLKPREINGFNLEKQKEFEPDKYFSKSEYNFYIELSPAYTSTTIKDNNSKKIKRYFKGPNAKEKRKEWVIKQFEKRGMSIIEPDGLLEYAQHDVFFKHKNNKGKKTLWKYKGSFVITDKKLFIENYKKGIGTGKSYGAGMLIVC